MIRVNSPFGRFVSCFVAFTMLNAFVPYWAFADVPGKPKADKPAPKKLTASRPMKAREMKSMAGSDERNPYASGSSKWSVGIDGVDVLSGNFSTSATDLSFEGGYGIPVNITRTYSANDGDEGPFGIGWSLSVDLRSIAGALLKSPSAPARGVAVGFKERPLGETDPNLTLNPSEAVIAVDASAKETTVQRDADGLLTPPPSDRNLSTPTYEYVTDAGGTWRLTSGMTVVTPEGTTYTYKKENSIPYYSHRWNDPNATPQRSNVLKIATVTDRHGNVTTYHYGDDANPSYQHAAVTFTKLNGMTTEYPLTRVDMPGGRHIDITWGTSQNLLANRIVSITDGTRTVVYDYSGGQLTGVHSPAGFLTSYGYTSIDGGITETGTQTDNLLSTITDPRGLTTTMTYRHASGEIMPYSVGVRVDDVYCWKVAQPGGTVTYFGCPTYADTLDVSNVECSPENMYFPYWIRVFPDGTSWEGALHVFSPDASSVTVSAILYSPSAGGSAGTQLYEKNYLVATQDLLSDRECNLANAPGTGPFNQNRKLFYRTWTSGDVTTNTTYNFMGAPMTKQVVERREDLNLNTTFKTTSTVQYAYTDKKSYFQQKAVRMQIAPVASEADDLTAWRYSYTDYYTTNDGQASQGEVKRVYSQPFTAFNKNGPAAPAGTDPLKVWRYQIQPANTNAWSASFTYDSHGRPITVQKLQSVNGSTYNHVETDTTYGADGAPTWGNATQVVEDAGGINRTTQTTAFDSTGRAVTVQDAMGRVFHTDYDLDGRINYIQRTDGTPKMIVTYSYGNSGITNGQVINVTDNLSGVSQTITYFGINDPSGPRAATGMVKQVLEQNGTDSYTVGYDYSSAGDREVATYTTPQGMTKWGYYDYITLGHSGNRVFRTMKQLNADGTPTTEEFDYAYDLQGRLTGSTFAMTPQTGQTGYSTAYPAATRGRAFYDYDMGGRLNSVEHYWDTWVPPTETQGGYYTSAAILANSCTYDAYKGLKTTSSFWSADPNTGQWKASPDRTETYGYDPALDYLTSVDYGDGLPNAQQTWSYDAAGNRSTDSLQGNGWAYDNLNRITASPGFTYDHDMAGNRLHRYAGTTAETTYGWDDVNRMTSLANAGGPSSYAYRADGMRVSKSAGAAATLYRYDGQMGVEDQESSSGTTTVTKFGIGARGIDRIQSGTSVSYPIYDGHGNMVATLATSGASFNVNSQRSFGAWGEIRQGSAIGSPKGRYCASLGHSQDDESSLVYMRARYCDHSAGRFISSDPKEEGVNHFVYAANNPIGLADATGGLSIWALAGLTAFFAGFSQMMVVAAATAAAKTPMDIVLLAKQALGALTSMAIGAACFGMGGATGGNPLLGLGIAGLGALLGSTYVSLIIMNVSREVAGLAIAGKTIAQNAAIELFLYTMVVTAFLTSMDLDAAD